MTAPKEMVKVKVTPQVMLKVVMQSATAARKPAAVMIKRPKRKIVFLSSPECLGNRKPVELPRSRTTVNQAKSLNTATIVHRDAVKL